MVVEAPAASASHGQNQNAVAEETATDHPDGQGQGVVVELARSGRSKQPSPIQNIPNETLLAIFCELNGTPADFVTVKKTCRRFEALVTDNEETITFEWAKKQTGVRRILLENLYSQQLQPWAGLRRIGEVDQRAEAIFRLTDWLTELSCLGFNYMWTPEPEGPLTDDDITHYRRRCITTLVGAEICALEPGPRGLRGIVNRNLDSQILLLPVIRTAENILRRIDVIRRIIDYSPDEDAAIEYLSMLFFTKGARFVEEFINRAPYPDAAAVPRVLSEHCESGLALVKGSLVRHSLRWEPFLDQVMDEKIRACLTALSGTMIEWKKTVPDEAAWENMMSTLDWSLPLKQRVEQ